MSAYMLKMSSIRDSNLVPKKESQMMVVPKKEPQMTGPVTVYRIIEIPKGVLSSGSPSTYTELKEMVPQQVLDPSNEIEIQENAQGEFLTTKTPPNCAVLTADLLEKLSNKNYRKSKNFGTLETLRRHITIHNQECRPYHCDVCYKRFRDNCTLRKHVLIHTGIKPHKCNICNRCFLRIGDLNSHKKIHLAVKPFICQFCSKDFAKKSNLQCHLKVHGNNSAFMCKVCGIHYNFQKSLTRHLRLHRRDSQNAEKSVYICSICETRFYDKKELKKHLLKHNTVKEEKKQARLNVDTIHEDNNEDKIKTQPQEKLSLRDIRFLQRKLRRCREGETVDLTRDEVEHLNYECSKEQTSASDTIYEKGKDHVEYIDDKATFQTNGKFKHKNNINLEKTDIEIPNTEHSEIPEEDFNLHMVESEDDTTNKSLTVFHLNLTENATEPKDIVHKKSGESRIIVSDSKVTDEESEQDIVCKKTSGPKIIVSDTNVADEDIEPENIVQRKRETGAFAVEEQTKKHGSVNNMPDTQKSENSTATSEELEFFNTRIAAVSPSSETSGAQCRRTQAGKRSPANPPHITTPSLTSVYLNSGLQFVQGDASVVAQHLTSNILAHGRRPVQL
uniref:C2H2-type domain-containing protein n=1 Tax=Timema tahoe TaxID=61484 RepID=A0A7R9FN38_9NEOP|nr:unnamed protein product [Timema tahoe]